MARYNIALAALLASKAFAAEVSINSDGAMDRSLFSKVRHLGFAHALSSLVFLAHRCSVLLLFS
jgi:hypothetical protein